MKYLKVIIYSWLIFSVNFTHGQKFKFEIDDYVKPYLESKDFSGAILIADGDDIVFQNEYGYSNLENKIFNTRNTIFGIGSISKQFTAVSILLLEEQGKLNIQDKIAKFFPQLNNNISEITIHQLLSHTSGLPTNLFEDHQQLKIYRSSKELLNLINGLGSQFIPGNKLLYSNVGFTLLSLIIEKVSNSTFSDFLKDEIFLKLNLNQTFHNDNSSLHSNLATGYDPAENNFKLERTHYIDYSNVKGAGSLFSSVLDLHKWNLALHRDGFLSRLSYDKLTKVYEGGRGYGVGIYTRAGKKVIGHDGVLNGFNGFLEWYVDQQRTVVYLGNIRSGFLGLLQNSIASIMWDKPIINYSYDNNTYSYNLNESFLGNYELFPGFLLTVEKINGKPKLKGSAGYSTDLKVLEQPNEFYYRAMFAKIIFKKEGDKKKLIWVDRRGKEYEAKKI
ncbi:class A beta-lactamase-related serine hydrolase [Flavobacteriaceae bacterium AU392]|nr:class A beta-lactamase-related serine hydrolase [Flavobacteriaceae bacterium]RKM85994.1 class A beta-lactamase-related serine hydrolase [Flavobacteriaceae bacterium AU392]